MISIFDKEQRACAIAHPTRMPIVNNVTTDVTDNAGFNFLEEFSAACVQIMQSACLRATPESAANHQEHLKQY